jgi:C4-dicarboxylate-specific signal transduction histidine kinase
MNWSRPPKLAVLGQMATGITHELSQPLGAIRTLSANASSSCIAAIWRRRKRISASSAS